MITVNVCLTRVPIGRCIASAVLIALSAPGWSAEWNKSASVSSSVFLTDNFCLSQGESASEVVATVTPGGRVSGQGARANMSLNGRIEFNTAGQSDIDCQLVGGGGQGLQLGNRESVIPSGTFTGNYEAIENWLTLNANAFAGLNPINPFGPGNDDAVNGRGNDNITYRWGVGATLARRFEQRVDMLLSYNYNEQYNSVNRLFGDSSEDRVRFNLGMVPGTSRLLFNASGRYSEVSFDETDIDPAFTNTLSSAELRATFEVSDSWQINALVGEEFNEFLSVTDEIEGEYWDVGFRWSPNSRVTVEAGTGERFFGETPRASITYRHKRSRLSLSYNRTLTFPRNLRSPEGVAADDPFQPGFDDLPDDSINADGQPVLLGQSPVLIEAFRLNYLFTARRTRFTLTARDSRQIRTVDGAVGEFRSAAIGANRQLGSGLSVNTGITWRESEGTGTGADVFGQQVKAWSGRIGLSKRVAQNTSLSFSYRYTDQESDFTLNEFQENRLTVGFRHDFR